MNNQQISDGIRSMVRPWEIYMHELKIPYHEMGWINGGKCPFCNIANKFRINFTTGAYKCGACKNSGEDIFEYITRIKKIHFIEAIIWLVKHEEIVLYKNVANQCEDVEDEDDEEGHDPW
jgi:hypothetical protein